MKSNRKTLSAAALPVLAILFICALLVMNWALPGARVDLTQNRLYTLSQGTHNIVASLDEPVHLSLFWSDKGSADLPPIRAYATRVRELLQQIARQSDGKVQLEIIDPLPFSEQEDRAAALGLQAVPVGAAGESIFLGLVGSNAVGGEAVIPFLQPDKEAFLEYEIAKLVHELAQVRKPVVGLITGLPLAGGFDPASRQFLPAWAVYEQWTQLFDLRPLDAGSLIEIAADTDMLLLVHPRRLSDDALYAIDQFVLGGGSLAVFVDPDSALDDSADGMDNSQAAMLADRSSDLGPLFGAWHVLYDRKTVVLDEGRALPISVAAGQPPTRHPAIIGLTAQDLNGDDVVTAQLDSINLSAAGHFELAGEAGDTRLVPLMQSSEQAMLVPARRVRMANDPGSLYEDYTPFHTHFVLAARLEGMLRSAFPDRDAPGHIDASTQPAQIVLVADTDLLSDRLWVQVQSFFGQRLLNAFANNGDFAINVVDNLSGSSDLLSIRGRATAQRSFTRVDSLRRQAEAQFRDKEQELQTQLAETEQRLLELQDAKQGDDALIISAQQQAEIDRFLERKLEIRRQLRAVRRSLDADIDALGARLKLINIVLMPALLTFAALVFAAWRKRRRRVRPGQA